MMCSLDLEGHLRYYNRAFEIALDCPEHSMLGTKMSDLARGSDATTFSEIIERCSKDAHAAGSLTTRLHAASGTDVVCQLNVTPVVEKDGVVGISVFGRRMQMGNAIMGSMHLSSQLIDELLTFVRLMVVAFDGGGKIVIYNKTVEDVVARSSTEVLGSQIMDILDPKEIEESEINQAIQDVFRDEPACWSYPCFPPKGLFS